MEPAAIWTTIFTASLLLGAMFNLIGLMIWKIIDLRKSWVVKLSDTGLSHVGRKRIKDGEFTERKPGGEKLAYILTDKGAHRANRGRLFILHRETGWNLKAPDRTIAPVGMSRDDWMKMTVVDPLLYWRATQRNEYQDVLSAQEGKEPWQVRIAPFALIAVVVLAAILGFMAWKFAPAGAA